MNSQRILLFLIVTLNSSNLCAMRLTNGLIRSASAPNTSALHRNAGTLCAVLYSTQKNNAVIVHPDAQKLEKLKDLTKTPNDLKLQKALEQVDTRTKQIILISLLSKDEAINPKAFVALLRAGAAINMRDEKGQTPLHILAQACALKNKFPDETYLIDLLAYLAKFKPDFSVQDNSNKIPSDYAPEAFKYLFKTHPPLEEKKIRHLYPGIW